MKLLTAIGCRCRKKSKIPRNVGRGSVLEEEPGTRFETLRRCEEDGEKATPVPRHRCMDFWLTPILAGNRSAGGCAWRAPVCDSVFV
jgi:hypothetical protein